MIIVASLMTGASSPEASPSSPRPSSSRVWTSADASLAYSFAMAAWTSARGETTASTSRPWRTYRSESIAS